MNGTMRYGRLAPLILMIFSSPFSLAELNCDDALTKVAPRVLESLAEEIDMDLVHLELTQKAQVLLDTTPHDPHKGYAVFIARGEEIPTTMLELGRLRELTFRTVGEGTGKPRDTDEFDRYYYQLITWDKKRATISGGYRFGKVDEILATRGLAGVYSFTFFEFSHLLETDLRKGTLDLGRSFVRPEFQKGLTLSVLWAAIARYIGLNPEYKNLIGPVSISGDFLDGSLQLMTSYLMTTLAHPKANTVTARKVPLFNTDITEDEVKSLLEPIHSIKELEQAVQKIENREQAKLPPLIKLYVDVNVRFLGFNWDPDFNSLDGLIWTDVSRLPFETHKKYMGEELARAYHDALKRIHD